MGSVDWLFPDIGSLRIANLVLPMGISFYIFQSMSYTLDVYRRVQTPILSLPDYAAFVCYFPQLVAGPIERLNRLLPQIIHPEAFTIERGISGVFLFSCGFARKAAGDVLAAINDPIFSELGKAEPAAVVFAIFSFGLQIYFDFSGYTDMARGVSRLFGIELMLNFRTPYFSRSFREFWTRWHISLSQWLRDYLYFSLGGSRVKYSRHLCNLMITMLLAGLWHGAGWNFIIWGGLHGFYLVVNASWRKSPIHTAWRAIKHPILQCLRSLTEWSVTFIAVNYAWLYFRLSSMDSVKEANRKMIIWLLHPRWYPVAPSLLIILVPLLILDLVQFHRQELIPASGSMRLPIALTSGVIAGVLILIGFILVTGQPTKQFIYFQF